MPIARRFGTRMAAAVARFGARRDPEPPASSASPQAASRARRFGPGARAAAAAAAAAAAGPGRSRAWERRAGPALEASQQGALEGAPFGQWSHRGPIKTTCKNLGRVIYLANIPLRLQLPPRPNDLKELCFRTYPRAGKLEIKRVLQLVYGLDVEKVHTMNMDAKKKFNPRKKYFYRTASYKKCYVYLKRPISLSKDLFPLNLFYGDPEQQEGGEDRSGAAKDESSAASSSTATATAA